MKLLTLSGGKIVEVVDGAGSGLDADTLQGNTPSAFAPVSHSHSLVTTSADGFMSAADKSKLDGIGDGANVKGPGSSTVDNLVIFSDATGTSISDSGINKNNVALLSSKNTFQGETIFSKKIHAQAGIDDGTPPDYVAKFSGDYEFLVSDSSVHKPATLTIDFWFRSDTEFQADWARLVDKFHYTNKEGYSVVISDYGTGRALQLDIFDTSLTQHTVRGTTNIALLQGWHHGAVTFDGQIMKIYIDGTLENTTDIGTTVTINHSTNSFGIGGNYDGFGWKRWNGAISNVRLWDKALTTSEISDIKDTMSAGTEANLIGYWPMDDGTGNIALDKTSNALNATASSTAVWQTDTPPIVGVNTNEFLTNGNLQTYAIDLLDALKTVDGAGSGLDADTLQGNAPSAFASSTHNHDGVYEPVFTKNTAFNKNFGTTAGTVCEGNDTRLSDARTPTTHASSHLSGGSDPISLATISAAGLMSSTDKSKLDGIETGATADMTASEILAALLTVDGAGSGLDADTLQGSTPSAFASASHSHSFDSLTSLTSATSQLRTSGGIIEAGNGSGSVALTINDGYGNANLTFNHVSGKADKAGNAARIVVNVDTTTGAYMSFQLKSGLSAGVATALTEVFKVTESDFSLKNGVDLIVQDHKITASKTTAASTDACVSNVVFQTSTTLPTASSFPLGTIILVHE